MANFHSILSRTMDSLTAGSSSMKKEAATPPYFTKEGVYYEKRIMEKNT